MAIETQPFAARPEEASDFRPAFRTPQTAEPSSRRSYAELIVLYGLLALAAFVWGLFTAAAGVGIVSSLATPTGTLPAGEAAPSAPWVAIAAVFLLGLATLGAVLAYGRIVAGRARGGEARR